MPRQHSRRRFDGEQLFLLYLAFGGTAAVVGVVTGAVGLSVMSVLKIGCRPADGDALPGSENLYCPDGTGKALPALVLVGLGGLAVLAVAAALIIRRADGTTIIRIARHALWLATSVVAIPSVILISWVLTPPTTARGWGAAAITLAAIAFVTIPLITSYVWPARASAVLVSCLAVPVAVLLANQWLVLLVPIAFPLAGIWLLALRLWRASRRAAGGSSDASQLG